MITREGDRLNVSGALTMDTVAGLYDADFASSSGALVVDLAQVDTADSAAVGLMLAWLRRAQRENVELRFTNAPVSVTSLARVYGVDDALHI
ncbi:MAG: STAS domain-containing protein [Gallionellaceae bacterium]|jgi:phospholipid transport system transporter-binding protein|nr:STAS domain-containing protein [Gallionellaceae bacterium]